MKGALSQTSIRLGNIWEFWPEWMAVPFTICTNLDWAGRTKLIHTFTSHSRSSPYPVKKIETMKTPLHDEILKYRWWQSSGWGLINFHTCSVTKQFPLHFLEQLLPIPGKASLGMKSTERCMFWCQEENKKCTVHQNQITATKGAALPRSIALKKYNPILSFALV